MIRKILQSYDMEIFNMVYCDYCGAGITLNTDDPIVINLFFGEHENCTRIKNDNLAFLQDAEIFEG